MLGQIVVVAIVVLGNHLVAEDLQQRLRVAAILHRLVHMHPACANGESVRAIERLGPPAIENRQVEGPVEHHLLSRRARGLERPPGIVQPDIDPLHQVPGEVDVVVVEEHHPAPEPLVLRDLEDPLQNLLPEFIGGVRLPGVDELDGVLAGSDQFGQPLEVGEHQVGPLVRSEPAGEPDRQRLWIKHRAQLRDDRLGLVQPPRLPLQPMPGVADQPVLQDLVRLPEFAGRYLFDGNPDTRFARAEIPVEREDPVVEHPHLHRQPARDVHAVGDVPDGNFFFGHPGPERHPHPPADHPVQAGDGVGAAGQLEGQHRHAERFPLVVGIDPAQPHQPLVRQANLVGERAEVLVHQVGGEAVVSGGDGRVGGEGAHRRHVLPRRLERHRVFVHPLADRLEAGKRRVPLVHVDDTGMNPERRQCPHTANAQDDLLPDAGPLVTPIEARGEAAVFVAVLRDVRIEQEQPDAAHVHQPDPGEEWTTAGVDLHQHLGSLRGAGGDHGEPGGVEVVVRLLLPAVRVEGLGEVPLAVKQPDTHQRDTQVGGALEVIARQDPQPPRVDRERFVQPEFSREIHGGPLPQHPGVRRPPGVERGLVLAPPAIRPVDAGRKPRLNGEPFDLFASQGAQQSNGIVRQLAEERCVQFAEDLHHLGLPAPPEIPGDFGELVKQGFVLDRHASRK